MRENCLSGSEGGGAANPALPTPIQGGLRPQRRAPGTCGTSYSSVYNLVEKGTFSAG